VEHQSAQLARVVLGAANRTQARGSTVRLVVPRAPEVAHETGMELTDCRLLSVEEYLQDRGYIVPANITLTRGAYTITPAGLRWLEEALSKLPEPPTEAPGKLGGTLSYPVTSSSQTTSETAAEERERAAEPRPHREDAQEPVRRPWWRRVLGV
jgi:hypothetical protein